MKVIDGTTIKINRGDVLPLELTIPLEYGTDESGQTIVTSYYQFKVGDKIDFGIYKKKRMNKEAMLLKTIVVDESTDKVNFTLTNDEMKIGGLINKPTEYWYEVELNDKQTIIGYDDDGPKILMLYPEGSEVI